MPPKLRARAGRRRSVPRPRSAASRVPAGPRSRPNPTLYRPGRLHDAPGRRQHPHAAPHAGRTAKSRDRHAPRRHGTGRLLVPLSLPRARSDPRRGTNNATPLPLREGGGGRGPAESPGPTREEPPKLEYGVMTPAERLVTLYPDRATAILAAGGLPARL